ncbi:MipA/OmpV family protein [Erythrobacter sp. QSSC1-22B]|uniref:MipA/OmpV family protein n=1 Tax=Erythrobacter sp. QSSC1-22B TaxID=1860125 RepID=UPI000B13EEB6|nr:MipA/OmpV family protein [Erythrobacter sp. QSSC1-22B]
MKTLAAGLLVAGPMLLAAPLAAQDAGAPGVRAEAPELPESTVFDGDYLTVGIGVGYGASYSGSDDYRTFVLPIVQGSLAGVDISPRPAGVALDFIPDPDEGVSFSFGPVIKLNRDRADLDGIKDPVVEAYGELDTAIEVGPSAGVSFPQVLNAFDSLSFSVEAAWDVAGAHDGMSVSPAITYFTPLSRGIAASLSLSTKYIDDDYADYYYSVPATNAALPAADVLPGFQADGGFESAGVNVFMAFDLNGDVTDGGLALIALGGYSRMLGDAKDSPFTSIRGEADQFLGALGIGYTF